MFPSAVWCHSSMVGSTLWMCTGMAGEKRKKVQHFIKMKLQIKAYDTTCLSIFKWSIFSLHVIIIWMPHRPHDVGVMLLLTLLSFIRMSPLYTDYLNWFLDSTLFLHAGLPALSFCHVDSYDVFNSSNNLKRKWDKTADQLMLHQQSSGYMLHFWGHFVFAIFFFKVLHFRNLI